MYQWLRLGVEELKHIRSAHDLKIFAGNAAYGLSRVSGLIARHTRVPYSLQIEPTNCCNISCICCPRARSSRALGYMNFSLFRKIINDASEIGVKIIRLYLHGEPMLHPKIIEMLRYVKQKHLVIHLVTNGMLFDNEKIEGIIDAKLTRADRIIFSILGYSKEAHEKIMNGVKHEKVLKNLNLLLNLREKKRLNGPGIEVIFYTMPENRREKNDFYEYWHPLVDHVQIVVETSKQFEKFKSADDNCVPCRNKTCTYLWDRMTIFWNGEVTICMADVDGVNSFGNLHDQSIRNLWSCKTILSIKKLHKEKRFEDIDLCSRCDW